MYVVLGWFAEAPVPREARLAAGDRFAAAVADVVPSGYVRHTAGGDDWGLTVLCAADRGAYRWPVLAQDGPITAVSLGLPVGLDIAAGPVALARRLLAGEDMHRDVVPPFGLLALDGAGGSGVLAVQQDWLGMCRLFTGAAGGVTAFCTRPTALAAFLTGTAEPDLAGWASYAQCGHFGADLSPVRGVRLLSPGERITGRRRDGGGWSLVASRRAAVDDLVTAGLAAGQRPVHEALDTVAETLTGVLAGVGGLYDDELSLGLSGGKDSRLIAALLIAAGQLPRFVTNEDTKVEGDVARRLVQILRDERGLNPRHDVVRSGAQAVVLDVALRERTLRLQRRYDFQFPSTYLVRPAGPARLPERPTPASFMGAAGELATGAWYPRTRRGRPVPSPEERAVTRLQGALPAGVADGAVEAAERERLLAILGHARGLGLSGLQLIDYLYLVERVRKWTTSAYAVGMVTPFLAPSFVAASFALTPEQKRDRLVHTALLRRLMPEWADVPFVRSTSGVSTATRIWEGDGVRTIADLLDTEHGELTGLIRREAVEQALATAARGGAPDPKTLQQFTWLALAAQQLEPGTSKPATSATFDRISALPKLPAGPGRRERVRAVLGRSRLGRALWVAAGALRRRWRGG